MISLWIVFAIIIIHYIADFIVQTDWQAKNKSKSWEALLNHTFIYSAIFGLIMCFILPVESNKHLPTYFFLITFICHTIIDYFTSRWVKKSFEKQDYHLGFVKIGFDQILHYTQLLLTFYFLNN